jgi:hypothetical protein
MFHSGAIFLEASKKYDKARRASFVAPHMIRKR